MSVMRIRELREAANIKQESLATKMGVVRGAVANWESEVALPKARDLPRLARVLRCSIGDLFAESTALEPDGERDPCYYKDTASEE